MSFEFSRPKVAVSFIISFNLYISDKLFLHSSLYCVYNLVNV